MGIQNFPAALQPIIQQGFLEREFEDALNSKLGYRACADREEFAVGIGETLTKTRAGLKPSMTTPTVPSTNTNLDNGLTPGSGAVEQYTITLNHYAATTDLNMVTSRVGIASQFLLNAKLNGEQARRSLDELARNVLFAAYLGGNTRVRTAVPSGGSQTVAVDDVRGFQYAFVNGVQTPVGGSASLQVFVNGNPYMLVGVSVDPAPGYSYAPNGLSGTLSFSTAVTQGDGALGNAVVASSASSIVRPNGRATTAQIVPTDQLDMTSLLTAVSTLRQNAVPDIDGAYNCYLDPISARQLFADSAFRQLFQGATSANQVFKRGMINDFLGLRFVPTTEAVISTMANGQLIRRPIVCGKGALIEGDFAGMAQSDVAPQEAIINIIDGIAMVTREPIDRLQQIIAQSWYWIGGFCAPTDTTTTPTTVPTATNAAYKRAVMIEHAG